MSRVWKILTSTSAMEAKLLSPALFRLGVGLILFLILLLIASLSPTGSVSSSVLQFIFYLLSLIGLVVLAGFASLQSVGSRKSVFISLIALSGTSSVQWCCASVLEIWRTFLLIWIVRLPVLTWLHTQGNMDLLQVALLELLFLCLFAWLSSLSLMIGASTNLNGITFGIAILGYVVWEVLCNLAAITSVILSYYSLSLPKGVQGFTDTLTHFSIYRKVMAFFSGGFNLTYFPSLIAILLVLAAICLIRFTYTIYSEIGANTLGIAGESAAAAPTRKKEIPRCWASPLAWQAFYYHNQAMSSFYGRSFAYIIYIGLIVVMSYYQLSLREYGGFLLSGIGLILGPLLIANVCLAKESKEKTLPSLILAIGDPIDLYRGWQHSRLRMLIPDLIFLPPLLFVLYWTSPEIAYGTICVIAAIICISPLMFLALFLTAWSWRNIKLSLLIALAFAIIGGLGALVGWLVSWYLLPIVCIPLLYLLGKRVLHKEVPEFFDPLLGADK